jgi:hypothetical protein
VQERRCRFEDVVRLAQLTVFALEAFDLLELLGCGAGAIASVGLRLGDPLSERLRADVELGAKSGHAAHIDG